MSAPKWLLEQEGISQRKWKERKRRELREVIRVWNEFRNGCAYVPSYEEFSSSIGDMLFNLKREMSQENWGR